MLVRTTLGWTFYSFFMKVLGFIGDFFKSPLCGARGRTSRPSSSAEDLGWRYLNPRGSYSAVCRRNFPMQADVAPKVWNCIKTFMRIPSVGYALFAHSRRVIFSFCHKSFGFLKGIFQNPLKQVRTESATFRQRI